MANENLSLHNVARSFPKRLDALDIEHRVYIIDYIIRLYERGYYNNLLVWRYLNCFPLRSRNTFCGSNESTTTLVRRVSVIRV